jgi:hypothetical protein
MPKRLDDLPDLALDLALSYLEWPYVVRLKRKFRLPSFVPFFCLLSLVSEGRDIRG